MKPSDRIPSPLIEFSLEPSPIEFIDAALIKAPHTGTIGVDPKQRVEGIEPAGHIPSVSLALIDHEASMEKKTENRGVEAVGTHKGRMVNQPYKLRWSDR